MTAWLSWVMVAGVLAWTIVRLFGLESGYPLVALLAYTPYVAALALLAAVAALVLGQRAQAVASAVGAIALIAVIAPRVIPDGAPEPRPQGAELRVAAANLLIGDADIGDVEDLVVEEEIDILAISELTEESVTAIEASSIDRQLPFEVSFASGGSSGTGLRSRFPLERLPAPGVQGNDLPTVRTRMQLPGGGAAEVWAIHPFPPNNAPSTAQNERYLDSIPAAEPEGTPRLLIGDFNATLDHERLRDLLDRGYTDAAAARGSGLIPTWSQFRFPLPVTIDHVVVDERIEVLDYGTADLTGSDHQLIRAALRLP